MTTFPGSLPILPLRPDNLPVSKFFVHIGHGEFVRADLIQGVDMVEINKREIHLEGTYSPPTCNIYVQESAGTKHYNGYLPVEEIVENIDKAIAEVLGAENGK